MKVTPAKREQFKIVFRQRWLADGKGYTVEEAREWLGGGSYGDVSKLVRELTEECQAAADAEVTLPEALKLQIAGALGAAFRDLRRTAETNLVAFKKEAEETSARHEEEKARLYKQLDVEIEEKAELKAQTETLKTAHEETLAKERALSVTVAELTTEIRELRAQLKVEAQVKSVLDSILKATGTSLAVSERASSAATPKRRAAKVKA